ncbi:conserved protein, unknown function [Hepatocystis sp. ex Piliocolobus tephrosceles]|nr:conserved protein, unknown function [Hepatocystis sp. ex Piliocolobus tephrosceles]
MNIIRVSTKCQYFNHIKKSTIYSSVVIKALDIKSNEKLLINNVRTCNNSNDLFKSCVNFITNFEQFANICCGCIDSKNKVQLKKSIWFATLGLEIEEFTNYCYNNNQELKNEKKNIFEQVAKVQCPVILKDKNTVIIESEIAPKKVISSAKRIRYFFNISEVHTCRACHQKNKCKRFLQKYSGEPDFTDLARHMIGFYNMCKIYTKRNETDRVELAHVVENVNYFHFVLFYMYSYMIKHKHFTYNNVEEGKRSIILKYLKEKRKNMLLIKNQKIQEKLLNIPQEYSNSIIPTKNAKMKKKQKNIFEKIEKSRRYRKVSEDDEKFIWVEEKDNEEIEEDKNQQLNNICNNNDDKSSTQNVSIATINNGEDDNSLTEIKHNDKALHTFRFQYISNSEREGITNSITNYNKIYNKYTDLIQKKTYIDIDDNSINEDIIKSEDILFKIPEEIGGYTFINYIEHVPNNYILPINENLYKGIQVYKKEDMNISGLWKSLENESLTITKINFLNPFNIKQNLEQLKRKRDADNMGSGLTNGEDITDLTQDMSSFQEYIHSQQNKMKKKKKIGRSNLMNLRSKLSSDTMKDEENDEDNEDKRFEYFKKMRNERTNINENNNNDQIADLREEFKSIHDDTYQETLGNNNLNYKHTYNIRRTLHEEKTDFEGITLESIEKEKKLLIQNDMRELKDKSFYICKNVKFPQLKTESEHIEKRNRREYVDKELQKYINPKSKKKSTVTSEIKSETIKANTPSEKGSKSLNLFLKKQKKKLSKENINPSKN